VSSFGSSVLSIEIDDSIGTLWLDREEARNAMGPEFWRDLPLAMEQLDAEPAVRCIVLAAKGAHFSAGLDLKAMGPTLLGQPDGAQASSPATQNAGLHAMIRLMQDSVSSIERCRKPVIAAVHGYCIGAGVDLIAACDVRLSSSDAVFSIREARMAMVADLGSLQRLPLIIGMGPLKELALSAKDISASQAARIGLVNDAEGDRGEVIARARSLAREIASNSPLAVQGTKQVLRACEGKSIGEGLEIVASWNALYLSSNDLKEAVRAFLEKRSPNFTGS
jgi:enoyl-CoA hydratase